MNNIFTRAVLFIFLLLYLSSCGFKPMYKFTEDSIDFKGYSVVVVNENNISREIKEEIKKAFPSSNSKNNYIIEINVIENIDPLITNTDGTVSKYRIEIIMNFKVKNKN